MRTYRFKLDAKVQGMVAAFAKAHRNDGRQEYREAWDAWLEEHQGALEAERKRLLRLGYRGDANDKMYKAGRYYFRSRSSETKKADDGKPPRRHIATTKEMRDCMDVHIAAAHGDVAFRPAIGFRRFAEEHRALIAQEGDRLVDEHGLSRDAVEPKLKRTYKNRYFLVRRRSFADEPGK